MLEKELAEKEREYAELEEVWKSEKATLSGSQHIKQELDTAKTELEQARRAGDLAKMSELQYGRIPDLEKQLEQAETSEGKEMTLYAIASQMKKSQKCFLKPQAFLYQNDGRRERKTLAYGR